MSSHDGELVEHIDSLSISDKVPANHEVEALQSYQPSEVYKSESAYTSLSHPAIIVSVTDPATRDNASFTTYKVCVHDPVHVNPDAIKLDGLASSFNVINSVTHTTFRRFNQFFEFRELLRKAYPGILVPAVPEKEGMFSSQDPTQRARALHLFLSRVASHPVLSGSRFLRTFIQGEEDDMARMLTTRVPDLASVEQLLLLIPLYPDSKTVNAVGGTLEPLSDSLLNLLPYDYYGDLLYNAQLIQSPVINTNITPIVGAKNSNGPSSYSASMFSLRNLISTTMESVQGLISNVSAAAHASTDKGSIPKNHDLDRIEAFVASTEEKIRGLVTLCTAYVTKTTDSDTAQSALSAEMLKVAAFEQEQREFVSSTTLQILSNAMKEVGDLRSHVQLCDRNLLFELFDDIIRNLVAVRELLVQVNATHFVLEAISKTIVIKKDKMALLPGYIPANNEPNASLSTDTKIRDAQYDVLAMNNAFDRQSKYLKQVTNSMVKEVQWWREVKRTSIMNSVKIYAGVQATLSAKTSSIWQNAEDCIANVKKEQSGQSKN